MKAPFPVLLPVHRNLGEVGREAKDPAARPHRTSSWFLRYAQNEKLGRTAFCFLFSVLCLLPSASASEATDLGSDLGYLRVHSIVEEREAINTALLKHHSLVLDLRYPLDERDAGETLGQTLASQTAKPRLYILVSPATPVPVVGIIAASQIRTLVTLGVKGSRPEPEIVVQQTADADRSAYRALETGTPLSLLISGKIDKKRFDEASLVHEFKNGNHEAKPPETGSAGAATPASLTDRVLQRAVHLHRAQQALQR